VLLILKFRKQNWR